MFLKSVIVLILIAASATFVRANESHVSVYADDINNYIDVMVREDVRGTALSRPGAMSLIVNNIVTVRELANRGRTTVDVDREKLEWRLRDFEDRYYMERYIEVETAARLSAIEWEVLAKEYFVANPEQFVASEQVAAKHILISTKERSEEEATIIATSVREKLISGEQFDDLVKEYSEDRSAESNGGNLGYFGKGRMVPPFEQAAFAMDIGEISEPVVSQFGAHIIVVTDKRPASDIPFESVRDKIIAQLEKEQISKIRNAIIAEAQAEAKATVPDEATLEAIKQEFLGTPQAEE